jgi:hypothetical protein
MKAPQLKFKSRALVDTDSNQLIIILTEPVLKSMYQDCKHDAMLGFLYSNAVVTNQEGRMFLQSKRLLISQF